MPRIRQIKPSFWSDSKTGKLSDTNKCFMLGMLNECDDVGVVEDNVEELHARIFPYKGPDSLKTTTKARDMLLAKGLVSRFTLGNGRAYLYVNNFLKHQFIPKPSAPMVSGWEKGESLAEFMARTEQPDLFHEEYGSTTGVVQQPAVK